jgi:ubiquinone/menaquinone biosynthesis C-methylase UbiE
MVTCAAMTNLYDSDKVLEVACGPGFHTEILATSFIKKGAILVSCDIS